VKEIKSRNHALAATTHSTTFVLASIDAAENGSSKKMAKTFSITGIMDVSSERRFSSTRGEHAHHPLVAFG
jgi:hypothetical protein